MNTKSPEGEAIQISRAGVDPNDATLQSVTISAGRMEDGRVTLALSYRNGRCGADLSSTILDLRVAGIEVTGTATQDNFVSSSCDDRFSRGLNGDIEAGGSCTGPVAMSNTAAHTIDPALPGNFPAKMLVPTSVKNLTGHVGAGFGTPSYAAGAAVLVVVLALATGGLVALTTGSFGVL